MSAYALPVFVCLIVINGLACRVDIYEAFIEGAADGLKTVVRVFPYMAAMLCAVSVMRASGVFAFIADVTAPVLGFIGLPAEALPIAIIRPFSGSAALSMLAELFSVCGADSYAGFYASVMMGSTETVFYTSALYYGSVGVTEYRHTIPAALTAGLAGITASGIICAIMY